MAGTHYGNHNFAANVAVAAQLTLPVLPNNVQKTLFLRTDEAGNVEAATPPGGEGAPLLIDITYEQLSTALFESTLVPGTWYRLTDYQTVHMIREITVAGIVTTTEENVGPIEPLILFAHKSDGYLETLVYSAVSGDRVYYYANGAAPALPQGTVFKGNITRRIVESRNISAPLDWQVVVWKMAGNYYQLFNQPYDDPGDPDLLQPRYGDGHDIYIGNALYDQAMPIIFLSETQVINNVTVGIGDRLVVDYMRQSDILVARIIDVNIRALHLHNLTLENVIDFIIAPISPIVVENITANASNASITVADGTAALAYSNSFLYRAQNGLLRMIKVDTDTNTIQIVTPI